MKYQFMTFGTASGELPIDEVYLLLITGDINGDHDITLIKLLSLALPPDDPNYCKYIDPNGIPEYCKI